MFKERLISLILIMLIFRVTHSESTDDSSTDMDYPLTRKRSMDMNYLLMKSKIKSGEESCKVKK